MEILTIIPARGGSKSIPRKNIRPVLGKPLIAYSIEQASSTPAVTRVVVSTDDAEIADVARQYGAEIVQRPAEIAGDNATSESALLHVLDHLRDAEGYTPDLVVFLQATSPLRQPDDIQRAITTLIMGETDSLFSASMLHGFVWRQRDDTGEVASFTYDHTNRPRRQDLHHHDVQENGSIYVFKPSVLREHNNRLGGKVSVHVMDTLDSFQVDDPADLDLMERLLLIRAPKPASVNLSAIKLLVLDFDGVMTDNRVLVDQDGVEAVFCHRGDGWGIARLKEAGVEVIVISTEANTVVSARSRKLKIECLQDRADKLEALQLAMQQRGLTRDQVAYVGNDVNDLEAMGAVGVPIAVSDAVPEVRRIAALVTSKRGGDGAVREVCDWIIASQDGREL
jgi:YrbI family 3-deoxy-D-manno-octulosonate 8-phosphate phosphatase